MIVRTLLIVGIGVVAAVACAIGLLWTALRMVKRLVGTRVAAAIDPADILLQDLGANFFGLESAGVMQVRGNGALVLTPDAIEFFMLIPARRMTIPLADVTRVELVMGHLGKTVFRRLLKVQFTRDGKPDSVAWLVRDPAGWRDRITTLLQG